MNRTRAREAFVACLAVVAATVALIAVPVAGTSEGAGGLKFDVPAPAADPFRDPSGPYFHDVFRASSSDGVSFSTGGAAVFSKASVPDVIRLPSGRLLVYAVDGAGRSQAGLRVAVSDNKGRTWRQGSVQLKSVRVPPVGADPDVVLLPNGKLRLFYVVMPMPTQPGAFDPQAAHQVLSAVSSDGVSFKEEPGTRFERAQVTDPDVVRIGSRWLMYLSQGPRLIAASSQDGLRFTFERVIREQGSVSATVHAGGGTWRQFYCDGGIRSAVSADGLEWAVEEGMRVGPMEGKTVCDPAPLLLGGGWVLFYKVGPAQALPVPG
jgi:hypothetical protein